MHTEVAPCTGVIKAPPRALDPTGLEEAYYRLYREFFSRAEKKRRWSMEDDIPWDQVNRSMNPEIADVVESFCAVELYLPDYMAKILPLARNSRGRAWFHANWGYEESKHSMALGDWLLHSGLRSEEQMADLESRVFAHEWNLPHDSPMGMVIYGMAQELATWLHYRNLREKVKDRGDGALDKMLGLIAVDERAHHAFYRQVTQLYLERDRAATLEQLRRVLHDFNMPAVYMLSDSDQRKARVRDLEIFNEEIYYQDVYLPLLASLGVSRHEMRRRTRREYVVGNGTSHKPTSPAQMGV